MSEERLVFNGINGASGEYLLPPLSAGEVSRLARGEALDPQHLKELQWKHQWSTQATLGPAEGIDPKDLAQAGWGVVFAHDADPAVREALGELLAHRKAQAGAREERYYREFAGPDGYRPGESKLALPGPPRRGPRPGRPGPGALLPAARGRPGGDPLGLPVPAGRAVRRGAPALRHPRRVRPLRPQRRRRGDAGAGGRVPGPAAGGLLRGAERGRPGHPPERDGAGGAPGRRPSGPATRAGRWRRRWGRRRRRPAWGRCWGGRPPRPCCSPPATGWASPAATPASSPTRGPCCARTGPGPRSGTRRHPRSVLLRRGRRRRTTPACWA